MAEWTGRKRTLNSVIPEGQPLVDAASDHLPAPRPAPGATNSPQLPGATPDTPNLRGRSRGSLPPLSNNRRPLTEFGTAQRMLGLFTPEPGTELQATDWEQGLSAFEERRKADSALLTPERPLSGYGLGLGRTSAAIAPAVLAAVGDLEELTLPVPTAAAGLVPEAKASSPAPAPAADVAPSGDPPPLGAVHGDGTATCAPGFPIKGNAQSKIYHTTASRSYEQTIAEFCFESAEAAEAAGFRPPRRL